MVSDEEYKKYSRAPLLAILIKNRKMATVTLAFERDVESLQHTLYLIE